MTTSKITVTANISAAGKKTWDYYTQPEHITQWNFASDDWRCPSATNDLRIGGTYKARMEAKDGSHGFHFEGTYTDIIEGRALTFVMPDQRMVNVKFDGDENNTTVAVTFDADTEHPIEMQRNGWQAILDNFKKHTESN